MGTTRDLFKKIEDTKGISHANMGTIKDRNGKDLTEAEEINRRWQEYTEELFNTGLNNLDNMMMWSLIQGQTSWSMKLSGPQEALL